MTDGKSERDPSSERTAELGRRLMDLGRWMMMEGMIDPKNGTDFELCQFDTTKSNLNPETMRWDGPRKFIVGFGMPDPIESGFNEIAANTILEEEN